MFGPGADPRGAGIGTKIGIVNTWSYNREIISDTEPIGEEWVSKGPI
jgi:hypothetical protein